VDAATHLGLITWTYRPRGNPTTMRMLCGGFTHQRSAVRYRPRPPPLTESKGVSAGGDRSAAATRLWWRNLPWTPVGVWLWRVREALV